MKIDEFMDRDIFLHPFNIGPLHISTSMKRWVSIPLKMTCFHHLDGSTSHRRPWDISSTSMRHWASLRGGDETSHCCLVVSSVWKWPISPGDIKSGQRVWGGVRNGNPVIGYETKWKIALRSPIRQMSDFFDIWLHCTELLSILITRTQLHLFLCASEGAAWTEWSDLCALVHVLKKNKDTLFL